MKQLVRIAGATGMLTMLFTAGGVSAADRTINAGASGMQLRVFDLTPADGVAAGYSVNGFNSTLAGSFWPSSGGSVEDEIVVQGGQADALSVTFGGRTIAATVAAEPGMVDVSYTMPLLQQPGATALASGTQIITLTLKPHSLLVVNGNGYAGANNWQAGWIMSSEVNFTLFSASNAPVSSIGLSGRNDANYLIQRDLQLAYSNVSDQDMSVYLKISTSMSVAAVPEPATGFMLATGAAVIGFAGRRRKNT